MKVDCKKSIIYLNLKIINLIISSIFSVSLIIFPKYFVNAITEEKNLLRIVFSFFKDKESAKDGFKLNGFAVQIPVVFTTENGNLKVFVDCGEIKCSSGLYIENLSILPGLLSVNGALNGEHFIIPDGSGSLVDLSVECPEEINLSLDVFGSDIALKDYKMGATLPLYAFVLPA